MRLQAQKIAVIIPAYNEEKSIAKVLKSIPLEICGIKNVVKIVINDGSSDNTASRARKDSDFVLSHAINLGLGTALTTGLKAAVKLGCDFAITIDGDGQHNNNDISSIAKILLQGGTDVVIGVRTKNRRNMPAIRRLGNSFLNILTAVFFFKWSSDSQSGLRGFNKKAINEISLFSLGYEVSSEIIGEIRRKKLRVKEVPIDTIYSQYSLNKGQSILNGVNIFTKLMIIKILANKK